MAWLKDIRAVLLDKDGTFVDFETTWGGALADVIAIVAAGDEAVAERLAEALAFDRATRRFAPHSAFVGGSQQVYGPLWARALGRPFDEYMALELVALFSRASAAHLAAISGAREAIAALAAAGYPLGVATNDAEASAHRQIAALGLEGRFRFVAGFNSGHGSKPGGGMISAFAHAVGCEPGAVAMVGDSINDALAAREAGARMVGVLTSPEEHADFERLCDVVLPSIADLPALLATASV
jgi:phosphoglycolate phosphatase